MVKKKYVIAFLIIWGLAFVIFIIRKQHTLQTGTTITLKTVPIDPRDLFRGDYVVLRYDISNLSLDSIPAIDGPFTKGEPVYVKLDITSKYASPIAISKKGYEDGLFIKGSVVNSNESSINVKYGIEAYYVRQGTGKEIEQMIGNIDVLIALDKNGNALIKALKYGDKTY